MSGQPPEEAFRLVQGYRVYQMLVAACELKLPDLLAAVQKAFATWRLSPKPMSRPFGASCAGWPYGDWSSS